jgi:2,5-diamino-6-(ribosylamino)-4(3H)-pyrimidinone 5'-phosphate reductase
MTTSCPRRPIAGGSRWSTAGAGSDGHTRETQADGCWSPVSHATPAPYLAHLRSEDVPYLVAGDGPVDLGDALRTMKSRLGATCVVSEAGGGLNGALLRSGLVDELHLMLLPSLVGGLGTPTIFDGVPLQLGQLPTRLRLLDARVTTDGIVSLHYEIDRQPVSGALPGDEKLV